MSRAVDEIIVNDIQKDLLEDMMIGDSDIDDSTVDFMSGWDEEAQEYDEDQNMIFPQPITNFDEYDNKRGIKNGFRKPKH